MNAMKAESMAYFRALGKHLTERRKALGMTQAELSRALGVSQQTVFAYELGDRRVNLVMLMKLARIFDVPVEHLLGLANAPPPAKGRLSPAGVRHAEQFAKLSKAQQRFVAKVIETLLAQRMSIASK